MSRILISVGLLYVVTLMAGPVFAEGGHAAPQDLTIVISPSGGEAGDNIAVVGSGADPTKNVTLSLSSDAHSSADALASTEFSTSADGTFEASIAVPADTADGQYYVRAEQFRANGSRLHYYYNAFIVGISGEDALLPETGTVAGTPFTATATLSLLLLVAMGLRGLYAIRVKS